jgi:hypothetical protein
VDLRLDDDKEIAEAFNRIIHNKPYLPRWVEETAERYSLALRLGIVRPDELVTKEIDIHILEQEVSDVHMDKKRTGAY